MAPRRDRISAEQFVVRLGANLESKGELKQLKDLAEVKKLGGRLAGWLVTLNDKSLKPSGGWGRLHALLGDAYSVIPALVGEEGKLRYPTGNITLRFDRAVSDEEIQELASQFNLELVGRSKFTTQQAMFKPVAGSEVFLPDLSDELAQAEHIELAWLDAESAYERGG